MKPLRQERIRRLFEEKPFVSLKELSEMFPHVTSMTLRRDIEDFEARGEVIKVRGGARSMKFITTSMEEPITKRLGENTEIKERIAACALRFIEEGRSIFLDSGTTALALASFLKEERVTVTTTGPNVATELIKNRRAIVNLVGGMLNRENLSVSGGQAKTFIENINIDIAFITPSGFSVENGFTCGNFQECELKSAIIKKTKKVILLVNSEKLNKNMPYTFCDFSDVDIIVTDKVLPNEILAEAQKHNVEIIVAE